jgi:hypothetical protein
MITQTYFGLPEAITLKTPAGKPDWVQISQNIKVLSGQNLFASIKQVFPVASAGANLETNDKRELS